MRVDSYSLRVSPHKILTHYKRAKNDLAVGKSGWYHLHHMITVSTSQGMGHLFGGGTASSLWCFCQKCMSCVWTRGNPEKPKRKIVLNLNWKLSHLSVSVWTQGNTRETQTQNSPQSTVIWASVCGHEETPEKPRPSNSPQSTVIWASVWTRGNTGENQTQEQSTIYSHLSLCV